MGLVITPAKDLLLGFHCYVEVSPKEYRDEDKCAIVRSGDYIADSGTDCPVCGSCDCIKNLPDKDMGLTCTECETVWFTAKLDELEED